MEQTFCGGTNPPTYTSYGQEIKLKFVTDGSEREKGFTIEYQSTESKLFKNFNGTLMTFKAVPYAYCIAYPSRIFFPRQICAKHTLKTF